MGKTKRGMGTKWMVLHPSDEDLSPGTPVLVDGQGLPLGVRLESASPGEAHLAEATLAEVRVPRAKGRPRQKPKRIIADKAYDSDPLRERLGKRGIELIVPYRQNSRHRRHEDGRKLRRYRRRWIVERTNAGLDNSVGSWSVINIFSSPTEPSSISPASGLHSGGVYETRSRYNGFVDLEYEVHGDDPMPGAISSFAYMWGVLAGIWDMQTTAEFRLCGNE